jgi:hypothetical protein
MVPDIMTLGKDTPHEIRISSRVLADNEEGCVDVLGF